MVNLYMGSRPRPLSEAPECCLCIFRYRSSSGYTVVVGVVGFVMSMAFAVRSSVGLSVSARSKCNPFAAGSIEFRDRPAPLEKEEPEEFVRAESLRELFRALSLLGVSEDVFPPRREVVVFERVSLVGSEDPDGSWLGADLVEEAEPVEPSGRPC